MLFQSSPALNVRFCQVFLSSHEFRFQNANICKRIMGSAPAVTAEHKNYSFLSLSRASLPFRLQSIHCCLQFSFRCSRPGRQSAMELTTSVQIDVFPFARRPGPGLRPAREAPQFIGKRDVWPIFRFTIACHP